MVSVTYVTEVSEVPESTVVTAFIIVTLFLSRWHWCDFIIWALRWSVRLNCLSQWLHWNFMPWWTLKVLKYALYFLNFNVILTYVCLMYDEFLIYFYLLICLSKLWRPLEALKILLQNSHLCLMPSWMPATCFLKWLCFKNFLSHCLHWCSLVP